MKAPAEIKVQIGGGALTSYFGEKGVTHFGHPFNGATGEPKFEIVRDGAVVKSQASSKKPITASTKLQSGLTNYNAFVGGF